MVLLSEKKLIYQHRIITNKIIQDFLQRLQRFGDTKQLCIMIICMNKPIFTAELGKMGSLKS